MVGVGGSERNDGERGTRGAVDDGGQEDDGEWRATVDGGRRGRG